MSGLRHPEAPPETGHGTPKERLRLWLKLLKATRMVEAELRERLRLEFETTLPRFDVLAALRRAPKGLRMSALSAELKVSNGNVTGIVDRLVADGFVVRVPVDNDRRAMVVRLTERGKSRFDAMAQAHESWIDGLMGGVSPEMARDLSGALDQVSAEALEHMKTIRDKENDK
jgi:DNA-binding MarR family transcriptional regulator